MSFFCDTIVAWYLKSARDLPWRNDISPYKTWVSEIILQQTRIEQGLPYYLKFIDKFRDVNSLANAKEDEVLSLWQGLGYYTRARNMHKCARKVVEDYGAIFPKNYNDLLKLPGIGKYTAAAIASICYGEQVAVVDGNVQRFVARFLGITDPVNTKIGAVAIENFVNEEIKDSNPSIFNQAMMEMGALVCKPANPLCSSCVLNEHCYALRNKQTDVLPVKINKVKVRTRYLNYFIVQNGDKVLLTKRKVNDVWASLHEIPLIESTKSMDYKGAELLGTFKHLLTHQKIYAQLWKVFRNDDLIYENTSIFEVKIEHLENYPVHQLMKKMIQIWQE